MISSSNAQALVQKMLGYTVSGRYTLVDFLGAGTYGIVFKAEDLEAGPNNTRYYAMKALPCPLPGSRHDKLIKREVCLHQRASGHRNVIGLHKTFLEAKTVFLLLDLVESGTLADFMCQPEFYAIPNRNEFVRSTMLSILDGVEHCHSRKVYHRDLKLDNILCSSNGSDIRIADFGLATDEEVTSSVGCGTKFYMPPECLDYDLHDWRVSPYYHDIWSIGVILLNVVTQRNPWYEATLRDVGFTTFFHDPDYLYKTTQISSETSELLKGIFVPQPEERLSIPQIRDQIMNIESFSRQPPHSASAPRQPTFSSDSQKPVTIPVMHCSSSSESATGGTFGPITPDWAPVRAVIHISSLEKCMQNPKPAAPPLARLSSSSSDGDASPNPPLSRVLSPSQLPQFHAKRNHSPTSNRIPVAPPARLLHSNLGTGDYRSTHSSAEESRFIGMSLKSEGVSLGSRRSSKVSLHPETGLNVEWNVSYLLLRLCFLASLFFWFVIVLLVLLSGHLSS